MREELVRLSQALAGAKRALAEHQFDQAALELEQAASLAVIPEHQELVRRLGRLAACGQQFWSVVAQVMRGFSGAEELTVGADELIVLVVETGPDWIIIRSQGKNTRYTLADMPVGLALAIARRRLDTGRVEDLILLGACLAAQADLNPTYVNEARRYWLQAQSAGADVDDLLQTLTDSYDLTE